ncbi:MAG TPA: filamentous hemagglutinin family protein [Thermodesulfovibrionales bacterium]|nr:filamentous hemagglutinin family protein [Thermodesulfovibrionales bacterium]
MKVSVLQIVLRLICCAMVLFPDYSRAGQVQIPGFNGAVIKAPAIPAPVAKPAVPVTIPGFYGPAVTAPPPTARPRSTDVINMQGIAGIDDASTPNTTTINQSQQQAVIDWSSFNIGSDASVIFNQQKNSNWAALNRIRDKNPSLIFGKLSADGTIYLINQNGILFGPGSQVNVHSLTASALNITNGNFLGNVLQFNHEDYNGTGLNPLATVSNHGEIDAADTGYVFLMAPRVENYGTITAPIGQIGLVAGTDMAFLSPSLSDTSRSGFYIILNDDFKKPKSNDATFGNAVNRAGAALNSDGGIVGMYGNNVDQWGIIRSMTAFKNRQGQVELRAANKITTYDGSSISLPVNLTTTDTVNSTFDIQPHVDMGGLQQPTTSGVSAPTPVAAIELNGVIQAPTGKITLSADKRVYLGETGVIDVSGVKAELPANVLTDFKLTSVELRDDYAEKDGVLQGQKITTPLLSGSSIGDVSQAILTREKTPAERSIGGDIRVITDPSTGALSYVRQTGEINVTAASGDVIVKKGALIDISGGAVTYRDAMINSTKLLSGTKIYDISNAPANLHYDGILGQYEETNERFGITKSYAGLYYGGAAPLMTYVSRYTQGGDAGSLLLSAPKIVLDGQLKGSVTSGPYQTAWTKQESFSSTSDYLSALTLSVARGLEAPRKGTVTIGNENPTANPKSNTTAISIVSDSPPQDVKADSPLQTGQTVLSAKTLDEADLGTLKLYADLTITTAQNVSLQIQPGGAFSASARRIEQEGEIKAPSGTIGMFLWQDPTSREDLNGGVRTPDQGYVPVQERIILGSSSRLDVSGEKIDNRLAGKAGNTSIKSGQTGGGTVALVDETDLGQGVFIQDKAVVDVSGGYLIDQKGKVAGGDAGKLNIQGSNIMLGGDLRGYTLADVNGKSKGGAITLVSTDVQVSKAPQNWSGFNAYKDDVPKELKNRFVLAESRLDDTGFTQITLKSLNDVIVEPDTTLSPSPVRLNSPQPLGQAGAAASPSATGGVQGRPDLIRVDDSIAGPSSFTAVAGSPFQGSAQHYGGNLIEIGSLAGTIAIGSGSLVRTAPAASSSTGISLNAPIVDVAGSLKSPGGNIRITATVGDVKLEKNAEVNAAGYLRPDPTSTPKGAAVNYQPVDAGNVALYAAAYGGKLVLNEGSTIDISGSRAVTNRLVSGEGMVSYRDAGNPGSLTLSYFDKLTFNGTVVAGANMKNVQGAALTVSKTDSVNGMDVSAADMKKYRDMGFDDLTLKSLNSLRFTDVMDVTIGRKLTLDAPIILGAGQAVTLGAPWIVLSNRNSASPQPPLPQITSLRGLLTLSGQWIDVIGSVQLGGFQNVTLDAVRDIRLSEALYDSVTSGKLVVTGNLAMDADRIYPGNAYSYLRGSNTILPSFYSDYTLHADGQVTIQHTDENGKVIAGHSGEPIYSAGGSLTVEGLKGIDIENGYLAAPMGAIKLSAPGQRIYLTDSSVLTIAGKIPVNYGLIDSSNVWVEQNQAPFDGSSLPQKGITLDAGAGDVIVMKGAKIDVNGGGSFFGYKFQPSVQGSSDPLTKPGRYIVFKDNSFEMPGTAVYLNGGGGLSAGMYTLLPLDAQNPQNARYAFMPGAYILEVQAGTVLPGPGSLSKDGYPLVVGYRAVADTSIVRPRPQVYSVRSASDVLAEEGSYVKPDPMISGDGGSIAMKGSTTIIDGDLLASPLNSGFAGGTLLLSGKDIIVQSQTTQLNSGFGFKTAIPNNLRGTLTVSADSISGRGFQDVSLGDENTNTITIKNDSKVDASEISLNANQKITIESGAQLLALAQTGFGGIDLNSPAGTAVVQKGAVLHASHEININAGAQDIQGDLQVDHSALMLNGTDIFFVPDSYAGPKQAGLYITDSLWGKYSASEEITLQAGDIQFMESVNLSAAKSLTLDTGRIVAAGNGASVILGAPEVSLKNSGPSSTLSGTPGAGTFSVGNANEVKQIDLGSGDVVFSGFRSITLNSIGDVTLRGKGSMSTGSAGLVINAARVTTGSTTAAAVTNPDGTTSAPITAANFVVYAGANYSNDQDSPNPAGNITIGNSGGATGQSSTPGGMLEFVAKKIDLSTIVQQDGGTIRLTSANAGGGDGIFLHRGAQILAGGTDDAPGGRVTLRSDNGSIVLDRGSTIDVSAGQQGDSGMLTLAAPMGSVIVNGELKGAARNGKGGSFELDTSKLSEEDMTGLIGTLNAGGFTESVDLRARSGNIDIAADQKLTANHVKLTADDDTSDASGNLLYGKVTLLGTIDASSSPGAGKVELYANNDINVAGAIRAKGTAKGEEDVVLSSENGSVNLQSTGLIDVTGKGIGQGVVHLRAQQKGNDAKMNLDGTIAGASAVYAEAFKLYDYDGDLAIGDKTIQTWMADTQNFMGKANTSRLLANQAGLSDSFHLLPGIEVRSSGDISLNTAWDLSSMTKNKYDWRYGGEPGVLTLRAAGNLNINENLVDHPTTNISSLRASSVRNSWALNLTAGADRSSANYMAVKKGSGDLFIAEQTVVYTESAPIGFASGNDTVMGAGSRTGYMINDTLGYNVASYGGSIQGYVGRDLIIRGGAIQTATGDIFISIGRDLNLDFSSGHLGAIRTTGQAPAGPPSEGDPTPTTYDQGNPSSYDPKNDYWRYAGGGDIALNIGRYAGTFNDTTGWQTSLDLKAWDSFTPINITNAASGESIAYGQFSANYTDGTSGLATMGGGNLTVRSGGDFMVQAGTFGTGDLAIYSGGNIMGRFLNMKGPGEPGKETPGRGYLQAMGNFGSAEARQQIELFNSLMSVSASGDVQVGAVLNPSLASDQVNNDRIAYFVNCTYTPNSGITVKAGGDVTIAGKSPFYQNGSNSIYETVLPATLNVQAGENIFLLNNVTLTSSPAGNLTLDAQRGDIRGSYLDASRNVHTASVLMSDIAPEYWYGLFNIYSTAATENEINNNWIKNRTYNYHGFYKPSDASKQAGAKPLHQDDHQAIEIHAGGNIEDLKVALPKKADVKAGADILDIVYEGQNIDPTDISTIRAGGNIAMQYATVNTTSAQDAQPHNGFIQGGPGIFVVQAGGSIDLGSLKDGIQTIGNGANASLGTGKSSLIVVAGYNQDLTLAGVSGFFSEIRDSGDLYSVLLAGAKQEDAEKLVSRITSGQAKAMLDKMRADAGSEDAFYKKLTSGGDKQDADELLANTRADTTRFLGEAKQGTGYINMTSSQIGTSIGQSDIFVIANGSDTSKGSLNLGKTALPIAGSTNTKTGIATGGGGAINIFAREDINVQESRVMTFYGGDITVWSDDGNINAGRGSRTAVSASPPKKVPTAVQGVYATVFTPPAVGSGIRAVTYGDNPPPPGNIHLFAPTGIIDAGEAGIAGGQIILAAQQVVNVSNISFSTGSVGLPAAASGTAGIGTLSGTGALAAATTQLSQDSAAVSATKAAQASQLIESIVPKWIEVKVIDFVQDDNQDETKKDENKKN